MSSLLASSVGGTELAHQVGLACMARPLSVSELVTTRSSVNHLGEGSKVGETPLETDQTILWECATHSLVKSRWKC